MLTQRLRLFSIFALFILVFSLFSPSVARADEGTPPDGTPVAVDPVATEPAVIEVTAEPTEVVVIEATSEPTEAAVIEVTTEPTEAVVTETPTEPTDGSVTTAPAEPTVAELLPENTTLVVLDENGETLPLVSVEAANILETGDPVWCPAGQEPGTGAGCTPYFKRFTGADGLIAALEVDATLKDPAYVGAGTIYVQAGKLALTDRDKLIVLDGDFLGNISDSALTIQGGWDFAANAQTSDPSIFTKSRLVIVNWNGKVTLNQLYFDMEDTTRRGSALVVGYYDPKGVETAPQNGDVELNNILVTQARKGDGVEIYAKGNVAVNNVLSVGNDGAGLWIAAANITLNQVFSSSNRYAGAELYARSLPSAKPGSASGGNILIQDSAFLDSFGEQGVYAVGTQLTLNNVFAALNHKQGVDLYAVGAGDSPGGDITINGGFFSENRKQGIRALAPTGNVTLLDTQADGNGNEEDGPDRSGIHADGMNVTLTNVTADGNGLHGANIHATGQVNSLNSSFSGNTDTGLLIKEYQPSETFALSDGPTLTGASSSALTILVRCNTIQDNKTGLVVESSGMTTLDSNTISNNAVDLQIAGAYATLTGLCHSEEDTPPTQVDDIVHPRIKPKFSQYLTSFGRGTLPGCTRANGRIIYTAKSDEVLVPCGPGGEASAWNSEFWKLPGGLFQGGFVDALNFSVLKGDEKNRAVLPVSVVISFDLPYGEAGNYAIMYWTGEKWVDLAQAGGGNRIVTSAGSVNGYRFEAIVNFTGLFALVRK